MKKKSIMQIFALFAGREQRCGFFKRFPDSDLAVKTA